jgi:hypothetical protein
VQTCILIAAANRASDVVEAPIIEERPASPPPTTKRLTRRQLAKQEEELKQSQRAQSPSPQVEPESSTEDAARAPITQPVEDQTAEDAIAGAEQDTVAVAETETFAVIDAVPQENIVDEGPQKEESLGIKEGNQVVDDATPAAQEDEIIKANEEVAPEPEIIHQEQKTLQEAEDVELVDTADIDSEIITPSVEVTSEPEPKTLAAERPCDPSRTPSITRTSSRRESRSPSKSPMRIEESIEALDALEEALENVGKAVSHFDNSAEERRSPRKRALPKDAATPHAKTPSKAPLASRVSRAPTAVPKSMKPTSNSLARASSVRTAPPKDVRKPSTDTVDYLASKRRPVSVSFPTHPPPPKGRAPTKATFQLSSDATAAKLKAQKEERLKREADREAGGVVSKQRPISMPPVAKSTKAPTKATFQLPGEAVAAKLKAQKEERMKREVERYQGAQSKPRPVSMSIAPPTVKSTKPPTTSTFQLPGEAVAAKLKAQKEERLKREAENNNEGQSKPRPVSMSVAPPTVKSTKAPTIANFQLPGEAVAAKLKAQREERQKREEEAEAEKKAAAPKPRPLSMRQPVALPTRTQPGVSIPPPPPKSDSLQLPSQQRSTSLTSKRSSIQLSASRSASTSSNLSNRSSGFFTKAMVTPIDAVMQKIKGKEVFNRDKMEKDAKDRERKEKEEAAKQARAQAAERGRIASREWAERQRSKMLAAVKAKAETT